MMICLVKSSANIGPVHASQVGMSRISRGETEGSGTYFKIFKIIGKSRTAVQKIL
eukprot:SAG11_NODE_23245_length_392_cov_1.027304_1_plen_54_part_10